MNDVLVPTPVPAQMIEFAGTQPLETFHFLLITMTALLICFFASKIKRRE